MKKNAKVTLETEKEHFIEKVIIEEKNNKINYKEQINTNVLFDKNNLILIRENNEVLVLEWMRVIFKMCRG